MKNTLYLIICVVFFSNILQAQDNKAQIDSTSNYIEFNDSLNNVNGVYLGLTFYYGQIEGINSFTSGVKIAYVADQKFEVGLSCVGFFSDQNNYGQIQYNEFSGVYGGIYLAPIFFGNSSFSLTMPIVIGAGGVTHSFENWDYIYVGDDIYINSWDPFFVFEPGLTVEYNISNNLKFEIGVKYLLTSEVNLYASNIQNLNGFSGGIGLKMGVFNLGKKQ